MEQRLGSTLVSLIPLWVGGRQTVIKLIPKGRVLPGSVLGPWGSRGYGCGCLRSCVAHECPQAFTPPARGLAR